MLVDLTIKIAPSDIKEIQSNEKRILSGHFGTHFDVMNKEFPLEYTRLKGTVFDISSIRDRDVTLEDIDIEKIQPNTFVAFYSGFLDEVGYGTKEYFKNHIQLSYDLIDYLIKKDINIIGVDFAGVRQEHEHTKADQYLADRGIFVVENLCNLDKLLNKEVIINTYPINYAEMTGLPCRVIAEIL